MPNPLRISDAHVRVTHLTGDAGRPLSASPPLYTCSKNDGFAGVIPGPDPIRRLGHVGRRLPPFHTVASLPQSEQAVIHEPQSGSARCRLSGALHEGPDGTEVPAEPVVVPGRFHPRDAWETGEASRFMTLDRAGSGALQQVYCLGLPASDRCARIGLTRRLRTPQLCVMAPGLHVRSDQGLRARQRDAP